MHEVKNFESETTFSLSDLNIKVEELKKSGKEITKANVGEPGGPCPKFIKDATHEAVKIDPGSYTVANSLLEVRQSISKFIKDFYGLEYSPEEILPTNGAREALSLIFETVFSSGDEIITVSPSWPSYRSKAEKVGIKVVSVKPLKDFSLPLEGIAKAITEKTKAIIVNNPVNPTGKIWSPEEIEKLAEIAVKYNLFVISDEVYVRVNTTGADIKSIASCEGMKDLTFYVNSFSKIFAIPGRRFGYVCARAELIKKMIGEKSDYNGNPDSLTQYTIELALEKYRKAAIKFINESNARYKKNRDYICEMLGLWGVECAKPEGAFYVFFKIPSKLNIKSGEFANRLLDLGIAVAPGIIFGQEWDDYIRVCYALSEENIYKVTDKIGVLVKGGD